MSRQRPRPLPTLEFTPPQNLRELLAFVDVRELVTAVLVVAAVLIGSDAAPWLFAQSQDIVVSQVLFEFPMALLAVIAGYAEARKSRYWRAALLLFGALGVALAGAVHLLAMDALGGLIPGLWVIYSRLAPPAGVPWFSVLHCKLVTMTTGAAWATLVGALMLLMLLAGMAPAEGDSGEAQGWVYAVAWGLYYVALAFILPAVRRHHMPRPKPVPVRAETGIARLSRRKTGKSSAARAR